MDTEHVSLSCDDGAHERCPGCACGCHIDSSAGGLGGTPAEAQCPHRADGFECSLPAGHDGEHRGHVSHDLTRAYVVIP